MERVNFFTNAGYVAYPDRENGVLNGMIYAKRGLNKHVEFVTDNVKDINDGLSTILNREADWVNGTQTNTLSVACPECDEARDQKNRLKVEFKLDVDFYLYTLDKKDNYRFIIIN
jgi:hypothetical protein